MNLWSLAFLGVLVAPIAGKRTLEMARVFLTQGNNDLASTVGDDTLAVNCSAKVAPERCPSDLECSRLSLSCMDCTCPKRCGVYGQNTSTAVCTVPSDITCEGNRYIDICKLKL